MNKTTEEIMCEVEADLAQCRFRKALLGLERLMLRPDVTRRFACELDRDNWPDYILDRIEIVNGRVDS